MTQPRTSTTQRAGIGGAVALIIAAVFAVEGGYVNDPADPGGATNHGITERVARQHGYEGPMQALRRYCELEIDENGGAPDPQEICASTILFRDYIERPGYLPIVVADPVVAEELIDTAVNMGPTRPNRFFQRAVNAACNTTLEVDGRIGPNTRNAFARCRAHLGPPSCVAILDSMDAQQSAEYDRLVRVNPRLSRFRRGWQNHRIGNVDRARCGETVT